MSDYEDAILPDDFVETPPQADETMVEAQDEPVDSLDDAEVVEDTTPTTDDAQADTEPTQPQKIKIKFNKEERELDLEEAAQLAQKGLNYEKAIERARQEAAQQAKDEAIALMGMNWNGKPITTEAEYKQAKAEQELMQKYQDRDLPEEVIQELLESRRDREERKAKEQAQQQEQEKLSTWNEFFEYFEEVNERPFDAKKDALPAEVEEAIQKGVSPLNAYMKHHSKELRNQLKIAKQNQTNISRAPVGSVTAGGGTKTEPVDPFLEGFNSFD